MFQNDIAWNTNSKMMMIAKGQFGGYNLTAWQTSPTYKGLVRRQFKTITQARTFAKKIMRL